jgi:hypothetical protein
MIETLGSAVESAGQAGSRRLAQGPADLAIHRISKTHHGRTLLILGHAAEHLADARRYAIAGQDDSSDMEAIHILMGLSRSVFDEFAGHHSRRHRAEQWLIERVVGVLEGGGRKMLKARFGRGSGQETCVTC